MAVDLKRIYKHVRTKRPELFASQKIEETFQNGEGSVSKINREYTRATPLNGAERHKLSFQSERF